ncbi:helix-turn-helix transcriptional regulator [Lachnospiraceae bacterium 46-61]
MNFLEKLDLLLNENKLNKHSLSQQSGIPYTTIDGWYKKGYDGLKLTTLRKLAIFFNTTLDYWAYDDIAIPSNNKHIKKETYTLSPEDETILSLYNQLDEGDKGEIRGEIKQMLKSEKYSNQELKRMA